MLDKKCRICGSRFDANWISEVYCKDCKKEASKRRNRRYYLSLKSKKDAYKAEVTEEV